MNEESSPLALPEELAAKYHKQEKNKVCAAVSDEDRGMIKAEDAHEA